MLEVDLFADHPIDFEGPWNRVEIITLTGIAQLTLAHDAGLGRDRGVAALKTREE